MQNIDYDFKSKLFLSAEKKKKFTEDNKLLEDFKQDDFRISSPILIFEDQKVEFTSSTN